MNPSPQLKLVSINLSGEKTKPPAPEIPGFPLDAPSKKIVVEEELIHNDLKASVLPQKFQGEEVAGLTQTNFLIPVGVEPNHAEITEGREEMEFILQAYSTIDLLMVLATIWGVVTLLLKIQLFLAIQKFHHVNFGIINQSLKPSDDFSFLKGQWSI